MLLQCNNITKQFYIKKFLKVEKKTVLKNVNFSVKKNEILSIIGLNGAGKTTLLSIILGITEPTEGSIDFNIANFKYKIGYMPEIVNFPLNLTPLDIFNSLKNIFRDINFHKIDKILNLVGLKNFKKNKLRTFSKGMLQRFNIAQSIIHNPDILILDEPFTGLDPLGRKLFFDIFIDLKKNGKTILLSSHILTDVEKLSDRILILHKGKIVKIINSFEIKDITLQDYFLKIIDKFNESD